MPWKLAFVSVKIWFQAHEVLALEILTLLLETPTDDSVEVAVGFLKECGQKLTEVTPRGVTGKNLRSLGGILQK